MITLNYTISEQEYKDFYYFLGWLSPDKKNERIKYYIVNYLIFFGVMNIFFIINRVPPLEATIIIVEVLLAALWYFYLNYRIKRHYHKFGTKVFKDSDKENSEMILSESGIFGKSKEAEVHYKWSAFTKKFETANAFYLYISSNMGLVIPKRVFKSVAEKDSFEKMLSQYLPLQADLPTAK
jgi:YcxB-like protein